MGKKRSCGNRFAVASVALQTRQNLHGDLRSCRHAAKVTQSRSPGLDDASASPASACRHLQLLPDAARRWNGHKAAAAHSLQRGQGATCGGSAGQIAPADSAEAGAYVVAVSGSAGLAKRVTARPGEQAYSGVSSSGEFPLARPEEQGTDHREETYHGRFRVPPDDVVLSVYTNV